MPSLRGLFCVIALPIHTTVLGLVAIGVSLANPGGDKILAVARLWSRIILWTAGVRLHPIHPERTAAGPYLLLCNHQSLFDIPALVLTLQRPFRVVAKRELFFIPIFGWSLRIAGFIGVDRSRRDRAIASLGRGTEQIQRGRHVVVFAEGTRSPDGALGPLKKGAFHIAQQSHVSILPVTFSGSRGILPREGYIPRPGTIDVHFGEPLRRVGPEEPVSEETIQRAVEALHAGYTERHAADLFGAPRSSETSPGRRAAG